MSFSNENLVIERKKERRKEGRKEGREKKDNNGRFFPGFTKYILKVLGQKYRNLKKTYWIIFFLLNWSGLFFSSQRRENAAGRIQVSLSQELRQFNFKGHAVSCGRT